jgi:hypothetical protein
MTNDQILTDLITNLKTDLINALQSKGITSSQTMEQIKVINNGDQQQLQIPGYLQIVEQGRGPTSKNPVPGNPPMIQRIQQWCREKGIPDKAAWAIKKKIDKVGYPAKPGILSDPLDDDNINLRLNQASEKIADDLLTQILNTINI